MTRPCVRCGRSIGEATRACPACVKGIRAVHPEQWSDNGQRSRVDWTCLICGRGQPAADWPAFFSFSQGPVMIRCPSCSREILRTDIYEGESHEFPRGGVALRVRLADVIRRSGVDDADHLIRAMEQAEQTRRDGLANIEAVILWAGSWKEGCDCWARFGELHKRIEAAKKPHGGEGPRNASEAE